VAAGIVKRLPVYAPLALRFDAERLYAELSALRTRFEPLTTTETMLRNRFRWFDVGTDYLYGNVERTVPDPATPGGRRYVAGRVRSWQGLALTHVPERPETSSGSSRFRGGEEGRWAWKAGMDLPYTRSVVARMPFERVDVVRVMALPRGGFGPTHVDWPDDTLWERDGMATLTLMARTGDVPMRFMTEDRKVHEASDRAFFFKDSAPHGVPRARSARLLLRIHGKARGARLREMMRLEKAVW
jgi:hypothetical protein